MGVIKKIKLFIGFDEPSLTLENKLFNSICLFLCLNMLTGIVSNLLLGFTINLILVELFVCAMCAYAFYRSRYVRYTENLALGYITCGILLLIPGWFYNGGVEGSSPQVGIFMIVLIMMLLRGRYHF